MNCIHCFRRAAKDLKDCQMDLNLFKKLIEEAIEVGVKKIVFSGWGEPLTHPLANHMLKFCKDSGLHVALNTNGLLLPKFTKLMIDYVDELYISLDAGTSKTYSLVRLSPTFNSIIHSLEDITRFKQLKGFLKPKIIALYTITQLNIDDIESFLSLTKDLGVNEVVFSFSIPFTEDDADNCLNSNECIERFYTKIEKTMMLFKELGQYITLPSRSCTPNVRCPFASSRALFIRCDGAITPCLYYAYSWTTSIFGIRREIKSVVLGYVGKDRLINVWRSRYAKMFYRLGLKRSIPSCLTCTLVKYCTKTRSNDVDCLGGAPNCGHCPFYHGLTFCPI